MTLANQEKKPDFRHISVFQPSNKIILETLFQTAAMVLLGLGWFFVVLYPWQGFIHSDHGLPFLMTHSPWIKQDFYYWGAARFGSLYVVFWKTIGKYLCGPNPLGFYLCHAMLFFIGLGFWIANFNNRLLKVCFLWIFLPVTTHKVDEFLFPGHLYGMVFFLTGLYLWIFIHMRPGNLKSAIQGIICGLTYWQHEAAGVGLLVLTVATAIHNLRLKGDFHKNWKRGILAFSIPFVPLLTFAEIARAWSRMWTIVPNHLEIETPGQFMKNIVHFLEHGLRFHGTAFFGQVLFWGCLVLGFFYLIRLVHRRHNNTEMRATNPDDPLCFDRLLLYISILLLLFVILINLNAWYTANLRHDRYYDFLIPPAVFLILKSADIPHAWSKIKILSFALTLALVFASHVPYGKEWVFFKAERDKRIAFFAANTKLAKNLLEGGCQAYLAPYWEAYPLAPLTRGTIPISATDIIRNPPLFEKILVGNQCCTDVRLNPQTLEMKEAFQCDKREGYYFCIKTSCNNP